MYFGRNLDWSTGYGQQVIISPRNYTHHFAFLGDKKINHAVIGMAIAEENTPLYFDCANEAGLAVAGLSFTEYAQYEPSPVAGKINIAAYEFPLWVMKFSTLDALIPELKNVALIDQSISPKYQATMQHWLIGDQNGSIVVEYTANGLHLYHNPADVLANQPTFDWHIENLRNYMNLASPMPKSVSWQNLRIKPFGTGSLTRGLPGDYCSPSRFVRAAYLNTHYPTKNTESANITRLFHTLAGVSMVDGAAAMADGQYEKTIYTSGFSSATNTYYYNTYEDFTIKSISLNDYPLDGSDLINPPVSK